MRCNAGAGPVLIIHDRENKVSNIPHWSEVMVPDRIARLCGTRNGEGEARIRVGARRGLLIVERRCGTSLDSERTGLPAVRGALLRSTQTVRAWRPSSRGPDSKVSNELHADLNRWRHTFCCCL